MLAGVLANPPSVTVGAAGVVLYRGAAPAPGTNTPCPFWKSSGEDKVTNVDDIAVVAVPLMVDPLAPYAATEKTPFKEPTKDDADTVLSTERLPRKLVFALEPAPLVVDPGGSPGGVGSGL